MRISLHEWDGSRLSRQRVRELGPDEVQVWFASAPAGDGALAAFGWVLDPEEQARAARFRVAGARREFVFARGLLRRILGGYLAVAPQEVGFGFAAHGKPFLVRPAANGGLQFNLSHSESHVAIALTRGRQVGVDIESVQRLEEWRLLAERVFLPAEIRHIMALPEAEQRLAFLRGWTGKEAYLKATGEGLLDELAQIQVSLLPDEPPRLLALPSGPDAVKRWTLHALPVPAGLVGALVVEASQTP